ncbi:hypothetical protein FHW88_002116 [Mucilaginibacter sp. SG538B]|uniref:hypothetical protein n=1 Tax=Mucilaginibacter sp. SG538B TaxID=2587021 RepID=UPI00159E5EA2|nr:hypothetical protein [Mucilaginibacter sp. SG538B]NVM63827.1 hypothetical protein [Mucilaginibacter sp. SG538B]
MEDLDFLLNYTEDLKIEIEKLPFERDDIRIVYFTYYFDVVYNLYISKSMRELSSQISRRNISITKELLEQSDKHIQRLIEAADLEVLIKSFNNNINRSFFLDAFSSFEVCLNVLVEAIISPDEIDHVLRYSLNEVSQILKMADLSDSAQKKLEKLLVKNHVTHVPYIRKIELLFKYAGKRYDGDVKNDREFLNFLSKLRNTIHTQWVYFGKDYDYLFKDNAHFIFKNGKQVIWTSPYDDGGAMLFIDIFDRLKEIWKKFIFGISFENPIPIYDEGV